MGTQRNDHLAAARPDLYLRGDVRGGRFDRAVPLLPVQLRDQLAAALLHADLRSVECRGGNRSEPQRQLPDAHGGRSRYYTTIGNRRRRDRRRDVGTRRQTYPACALATRLAARLCSPLSGTKSELYRCDLKRLPQGCGLQRQRLLRSLQAPTASRFAVTGHPAPVCYRQGRPTSQRAAVRTTTQRPRDDDPK